MALQANSVQPVETPINLVPRKQPVQKRSKERVERILDTLASLLDETGFDGISTNLIAERAEVDIASIYQYFPNKYAILCALAERTVVRNRSYMETFDRQLPADRNWASVLDGLTHYVVDGMRAEPGNVALRRAMQARPELRTIDKRSDAVVVESVVGILEKRGFPIVGERLYVISRALVETAMAIFDLVLTGDVADPDAYVEELKTMQVAYLTRCAEDAATKESTSAWNPLAPGAGNGETR